MNNLKDVEFKNFYFPPKDDIIRQFFIPALKNSDRYDRASGYFTSSSLVEISIGVCDLASRGGKIRIITSPRLNQEDISAIKKGYDLIQTVGTSMVNSFENPDDATSLDRISLLSELIAAGILKIKIAVMRNLDDYPDAVFHPKFGIMTDSFGNKAAFSGSMNESKNGMGGNWEFIEVSSASANNEERIATLSKKFEDLWNNSDESVMVLEMPQVVQDLIGGYRVGEINLDLDKKLLEKYDCIPKSRYFKSPKELIKRPYQKDAIKNWLEHDGRGIFNMATGTGKTKTALCALEELYNDHPDENIFTIIVAPQKHLVDQWGEEVKSFGVIPIIGHSDSSSGMWKDKFRRHMSLYERSPRNSCLITTISSFSSTEIQKWISKIKNLAIVVDEAHNMGSINRLTKLPPNAKYRLALSATIDRHNDALGTEKLKKYFGEECINLPIESAIGTYLANYLYHPIECNYSEEEYSQIVESNEKLDQILSNPYASEREKTSAKNEYIEYSYSLNAKMLSKFSALEKLMMGFENKNHFLVYCGKTKTDEEGDFDKNSHSNFLKVIDKASRILGLNGLGFKISRITYEENAQERKRIIKEFDNGEIDGIVAISCLDEGIDIPSIRTAVIMSSNNNPREYIQRRGRVLRLSPGKDYADIYDLIVIPKSLDSDRSLGEHSGLEMKALSKEILRMKEFSRISLNPEETENVFKRISKAYKITIEDLLNTYGEDQNE